jgi:putative aminopeptidase FrvX
MKETELQMLKELTDANGIAGNESQVRDVFVKYAKNNADSISYDGLGSVIAIRIGDKSGPKVLFAGHLDEVGFMVTKITKEGFIKFQTIGGWWAQVMLAQQVEITTAKNTVFHGVIGCKPPHVLTAKVRNKAYDIQEMFIDIGASSKEEAIEWGIKPGDMVTPYIEFRRLNGSKFMLAKAWDNRIGTAVTLKVLENLKAEGHPNRAFAVGNVQEEVGLRGAKTATHLVDPDIAFALDTGTAGDTPGMTEKEARETYGDKIRVYQYDYSKIDRSKTKEGAFGEVKLICSRNGKVLGCSILGDRAGEIISEVQVVKTLGINFGKLANVIHPYPTYAEVLNKIGKKVLVDNLWNLPIVRLFKK